MTERELTPEERERAIGLRQEIERHITFTTLTLSNSASNGTQLVVSSASSRRGRSE
jgi:hypothetical protein